MFIKEESNGVVVLNWGHHVNKQIWNKNIHELGCDEWICHIHDVIMQTNINIRANDSESRGSRAQNRKQGIY